MHPARRAQRAGGEVVAGGSAVGQLEPFTGTEDDLMWIRVEIEDSVFALETVRARGF